MHKNITSTIFYSLLFAMGGAPTIAMMLILSQKHDPNIMYQAFIGLSVIFACILVPLILIQNAYLLYKRKNPAMEEKVEVVSKIYLGLNIFCLVFWLCYQFSLCLNNLYPLLRLNQNRFQKNIMNLFFLVKQIH